MKVSDLWNKTVKGLLLFLIISARNIGVKMHKGRILPSRNNF